MAEINLVVPNIGDFKDVPIVEVMVKSGDSVSKDESLIALESDKAVMEVPSLYDGVIKTITVKEGDSVSEGDVIGTIDSDSLSEEKPAEKSAAKELKTEEKKTVPVEVHKADNKSEKSLQPVTSASQTFHASPSVRLFARELGADLSRVDGTGPKGRIKKEDVTRFVKSALKGSGGGASSFAPSITIDVEQFKKFGEVEIVPAGRIKKISAPRLQQSWQVIPHVTHFEEADISGLEEFRKSTNEKLGGEGVKLTVLAFAIKASVIALKKFPYFNSSYLQEREEYAVKKYYNIGFAADTPDGLVVPVVKNADLKGLVDIGRELKELSSKARDGKLGMGDMQGSTFTISSLGGIGGTYFTPIINPPEVAILGLSKAYFKPVWNRKLNEFEPRFVLPFSLSYDHRAIDGAEGARFCSYLADVLSDIRNLLL
jgi:pyruvate dehydrogenase E2 component (dihydrolipoamide acetyltransferase)